MLSLDRGIPSIRAGFLSKSVRDCAYRVRSGFERGRARTGKAARESSKTRSICPDGF